MAFCQSLFFTIPLPLVESMLLVQDEDRLAEGRTLFALFQDSLSFTLPTSEHFYFDLV
jgi:hypothetical protein